MVVDRYAGIGAGGGLSVMWALRVAGGAVDGGGAGADMLVVRMGCWWTEVVEAVDVQKIGVWLKYTIRVCELGLLREGQILSQMTRLPTRETVMHRYTAQYARDEGIDGLSIRAH